MDWNWVKEFQDKQREDFYKWLQLWYEQYKQQPGKISTNLSRSSDYVEPGDRIIIWIDPIVENEYPTILFIDEKIYTYVDLLNPEFDTLKSLFNLPTNHQVIGLIVSMYILNYDWLNKSDSSKWFLNNYSSIEKPQKPIITLKKLLHEWNGIQDFFSWPIRYRSHVIEDLMLSILLPIKRDISYMVIPPNWFKHIPNSRELPSVSSDAPEVLLQAVLKMNQSLPENIKEDLIPENRARKTKELISGLRKNLKNQYDDDIELLKKHYPSQYDTINQMVIKDESIEIIKSFLKHETEETLSKDIDKKIEEHEESEYENQETNNETSINGEVKDKIKLLSGYLRIEALIKTTNTWEEFVFNETQSEIVKALHEAQDYTLHKKTILENLTELNLSTAEILRMDKQFRNHNNWRLLIKSNKRKRGFWNLDI